MPAWIRITKRNVRAERLTEAEAKILSVQVRHRRIDWSGIVGYFVSLAREGLPYREIADLLEISEDAVKHKYRRLVVQGLLPQRKAPRALQRQREKYIWECLPGSSVRECARALGIAPVTVRQVARRLGMQCYQHGNGTAQYAARWMRPAA